MANLNKNVLEQKVFNELVQRLLQVGRIGLRNSGVRKLVFNKAKKELYKATMHQGTKQAEDKYYISNPDIA